MEKVRDGFIKNLRYLCLIGVMALGLMTIVGSTGDTTTEDTEPKILYVPSEYSTIQQAIDAGKEGDTIKIAAGTYNEQGLEVFGGLTIEGESAESTIIRGFGTDDIIYPPYYSDSTKAIVIKKVTIENGTKGIYSSNDILELTDCIVQNNNGSGIYLYESVATISNCEIADNLGDGIHGGTITISNSVVGDNTGDGIYCDNPDISYCTIYGNDDGISAWDSSGTIKNSIIAMNTDCGIYEWDSSLNLSNINFFGNSECNWEIDWTCYIGSASYEAIDSILTDPMFVDAENGDFHLQEGSPALTASDTGGEIGAYGNGGNPPD